MKDKWPSFFTLVFNICICIASFVVIINSYRSARLNDKEHIIYKNYSSYVEFSNGKDIEITGNNKKASVEKNIVIKNNGADAIYIDLLWNSIDLSGSVSSFGYQVSGSSLYGLSYASSKNANVPTMTSEGILMGEKIEPGDTVIYLMKIVPNIDSLTEDHLYASIMVNVRK